MTATVVHHFNCPYCRGEITSARGLVRCRSCRAFFHKECWEATNSCSVYGCGSTEVLLYRGRLGRFGQWPLSGLIGLGSGFAAYIAIGLTGIEWLQRVGFSVALLVCALLFMAAYRDPERNHLTRWMWDSCEKQSIYGAKYLLLMGLLFLFFAIGVLFGPIK